MAGTAGMHAYGVLPAGAAGRHACMNPYARALQMSGRAGRRGKDDRGMCIMMIDDSMDATTCRRAHTCLLLSAPLPHALHCSIPRPASPAGGGIPALRGSRCLKQGAPASSWKCGIGGSRQGFRQGCSLLSTQGWRMPSLEELCRQPSRWVAGAPDARAGPS